MGCRDEVLGKVDDGEVVASMWKQAGTCCGSMARGDVEADAAREVEDGNGGVNSKKPPH
jgi:hypothetical protein